MDLLLAELADAPIPWGFILLLMSPFVLWAWYVISQTNKEDKENQEWVNNSVPCPDCKRRISRSAKACPHCGCQR